MIHLNLMAVKLELGNEQQIQLERQPQAGQDQAQVAHHLAPSRPAACGADVGRNKPAQAGVSGKSDGLLK